LIDVARIGIFISYLLEFLETLISSDYHCLGLEASHSPKSL